MCARPLTKCLPLLSLLVAATGCLDLSPEGKLFACPGCIDAGSPFGSGGGTGGGSSGDDAGRGDCSCRLPEATCDGTRLLSPAASRCLGDGGCESSWVETECPGGCAAGACIGEPCRGVVCTQPPRAQCQGPTALAVFTAPGACQGGGCVYPSAQVSCECENDHCKQNLCAGVTCNQPPAATCVGASLRSWQAPGLCDAATGACSYGSTETPCGLAGCNDGQCNGDRCAGVTCNQPPAGTCLNAMTLQWATAPGTCNPATGACSYGTQTVTCNAGTQCMQGACVVLSPACNPTNCAGCCNGNTCVPLGAQGPGQCGSGASACGGCGSTSPVCENGACVNRCAGVNCNQPPAATCLDGSTVTRWAGGSCDPMTGACSYTAASVTCGPGNSCAGGVCSCVSEPDAAFCARLGRTCGAATGADNCGVPRSVSCGGCVLPLTCNSGACTCVSEPDTTFCGRLGKNCGTVTGADNCGLTRSASCGTCAAPASCGATNTCSCTAESTASFCSRLGKSCGTVSAIDNCGTARSVSCGSCASTQACTASNVCACVPESDSAVCSRLGKTCGAVTATDTCGTSRAVSCGTCANSETCTASNVCACVHESDSSVCNRLGKSCGSVTASDNCGTTRTLSCGTCASTQTCTASNVCACAAESDASFCARSGKTCGVFTGVDNCGSTRSASCGGCAAGQACTQNACVSSSRLSFSANWQTLPNTGTLQVDVKCVGTVTTTASGGSRCALAAGDPVKLRIDGAVYDFYPGCDGNRPSNCMTSISPTGATYADWGLLAAAGLLCDAMGWPQASASSDNNPGTIARPVAVVQTVPEVIGTAAALKNYSTYVGCEP